MVARPSPTSPCCAISRSCWGRWPRPHPGAQLSLFDQHHGLRYQAFATDTPRGQLAHLEARHRAHARVEDRIRCGKDTGFGRFPSRIFKLNAVWLELALTAIDLLAWTQDLLLDGDLASCEPKAARISLSTRRLALGGDRDHITTELQRKRFRHNRHPSSEDASSQVRSQPNRGSPLRADRGGVSR